MLTYLDMQAFSSFDDTSEAEEGENGDSLQHDELTDALDILKAIEQTSGQLKYLNVTGNPRWADSEEIIKTLKKIKAKRGTALIYHGLE